MPRVTHTVSIAVILLASAAAHADTDPNQDPSIQPRPGVVKVAPGADANPARDAPTGGGPPIRVQPKPGQHDPSLDDPGKGTWNRYDFVPGERTLWFEDFSADPVGEAPRRLSAKGEAIRIIGIDKRRFLATAEGATVTITLPEALPERFTVEVVYHSAQNDRPLVFDPHDATSTAGSCTFGCYMRSAFVECGERRALAGMSVPDTSGFVNGRFTIDGTVAKAYLNERRLATLPGAGVARARSIDVRIPGSGRDEDPTLVTSIRIAEIGMKLYDALAANGRVAARGILFDPGSDRMRPESTPTLNEITAMVAAHPELKLAIEAHTDEAGKADGDLELSRRRAAAVKKFLTEHGADAARLEPKGYGSSKPVASTTTAEGRADNRRVELVKI